MAIVIIVVLIIVCLQFVSSHGTVAKIKEYLGIFPASSSDYAVWVAEDEPHEVSQESADGGGDAIGRKSARNATGRKSARNATVPQVSVSGGNDIMEKIVAALNMYLQRNRGAASDFHLMKDVVERYCDAEVEEITSRQPIPLYLGLMGTMIGIVVGIGSFAWSGGFVGNAIMARIPELMRCVAIAMVASFVGVLTVTIVAWDAKDAISKVEARKNEFYSWLQRELLPTLSGNTANALSLLQRNLSTFNRNFTSNVTNLNSALGWVAEVSHEQMQLVESIKGLDIVNTADANVRVLRELKSCTGTLSVFNDYLNNVSAYLNAVNELNRNLSSHLDRTQVIEEMGIFFRREIEQVDSRRQYINQVVANVDDTLRRTFEELSASTKDGVAKLRNSSSAEFDAMRSTLEEEKRMFRESLTAIQGELSERLSQSPEALDRLSQSVSVIAQSQSAVKELLESVRKQNDGLNDLASAIRSRMDAGSPVTEFPSADSLAVIHKWLKFNLAVMAILAIAAIFSIILLIV